MLSVGAVDVVCVVHCYSLSNRPRPRPSPGPSASASASPSSLTWLSSRFMSHVWGKPSLLLVQLTALLVLAEFGPLLPSPIICVLMGCGQISFHFFSHVVPGIFFLQPISSMRCEISSHFCFSMYSLASFRYWICSAQGQPPHDAREKRRGKKNDNRREGFTHVLDVPHPHLLLEPLVAHLQRGHAELAAVELAEALGNGLPRKALVVLELEQQVVVLGHGPGLLAAGALPPLRR